MRVHAGLGAQLSAPSDGTAQPLAQRRLLAVAELLLGLLAVDGEDWHSGERLLQSAAAGLDAAADEEAAEARVGDALKTRAYAVEAHNALGALWFNRGARAHAVVPGVASHRWLATAGASA